MLYVCASVFILFYLWALYSDHLDDVTALQQSLALISVILCVQVAELYGSQEQIKNQKGTSKVTEEDFY